MDPDGLMCWLVVFLILMCCSDSAVPIRYLLAGVCWRMWSLYFAHWKWPKPKGQNKCVIWKWYRPTRTSNSCEKINGADWPPLKPWMDMNVIFGSMNAWINRVPWKMVISQKTLCWQRYSSDRLRFHQDLMAACRTPIEHFLTMAPPSERHDSVGPWAAIAVLRIYKSQWF